MSVAPAPAAGQPLTIQKSTNSSNSGGNSQTQSAGLGVDRVRKITDNSPKLSPREDLSVASDVSLSFTERALTTFQASPWTLKFTEDPQLEISFIVQNFREGRRQQRLMMFITPFICLFAEILLYWAFDNYRGADFFIVMGVNQSVSVFCAIFAATKLFNERSSQWCVALVIFTMAASIVTWELTNFDDQEEDRWAYTIMMMVLLVLEGLVAPLYKLNFLFMIGVHSIVWVYFTIGTFLLKDYHTKARATFFSVAYLITMLLFAYSAYVTEKYVRRTFVSKKELTQRNRVLRNHLVQLTKLKKKALDLESPMEKAVEIVRRWIADKEISSAVPDAELHTLMTILSNQDLWAPDFQDQFKQASVDNDIKTWVLYEWGSNRRPASSTPQPGKPGGSLVGVEPNKASSITYSALPVLLPDEESQLTSLLSNPQWNFKIFDVAKLTHGRPLYFVCYSLLRSYGLMDTFNIPDEVMRNFLGRVEDGYKDNPFHNRIHSADVVMNMDSLLRHPSIEPHLTPMNKLASILAAACHDYDHQGLNNAFQINSMTPHAIRYNDKSVLENHHIAAVYSFLLNSDDCNILGGMTLAQRKELRATMIETVLATDMALHFEIMGHFNSKLQSGEFSMKEPRDRLLALKVALKCADIGHTTKIFPLHEDWTQRIQDEFFNQGDQEKALGLDVSPFMDRDKPNMAKSQLGFLDFVCKPLFQSWETFVNDQDLGLVSQLERNYEEWKSRAAAGPGTSDDFS